MQIVILNFWIFWKNNEDFSNWMYDSNKWKISYFEKNNHSDRSKIENEYYFKIITKAAENFEKKIVKHKISWIYYAYSEF